MASCSTSTTPSSSRGMQSPEKNVAEMRQKLRILCLHGYLQNGDVFKNRIGSMRKALKRRAEFFFVSAPHHVERQEDGASSAGGEEV